MPHSRPFAAQNRRNYQNRHNRHNRLLCQTAVITLFFYTMQQHLLRAPNRWDDAPSLGRARWLAWVLLVALLMVHNAAGARTPAHPPAQTASAVALRGELTLAELPKQGQAVYAQIQQGGPFAFSKDGSVFGNYEGRLPKRARGYYREYTVTYNAASRSRGPRRLVCGGWQVRLPDSCYYSPDHYNSFFRIVPAQQRPSQRFSQSQ